MPVDYNLTDTIYICVCIYLCILVQVYHYSDIKVPQGYMYYVVFQLNRDSELITSIHQCTGFLCMSMVLWSVTRR